MKKKKVNSLRNLMDREGLVVAPGCHDALGARIAQMEGFKAVYVSGNATSAARIGRPDIGLLGMSEMVANARDIAASLNIPVICDADTGYGGVDCVARTVQAYEAAGVAAIHIEDQIIPKRCGAMPGIEVVSREEAVARVRAAVSAKRSPDFIVIARTDARAAIDFEEALVRADAFSSAGADMVIVEDLKSVEEIRQVPKEITSVPLMFDVIDAWPWSNIALPELEQMGYKLVIYCLSATMVYARAVQKLFASIRQTGHTRDMADHIMDLHEYEDILGLPETKAQREQIGREARDILLQKKSRN
jgi:2-methylisocitrate lyase-like PEP mutase family enzyme